MLKSLQDDAPGRCDYPSLLTNIIELNAMQQKEDTVRNNKRITALIIHGRLFDE